MSPSEIVGFLDLAVRLKGRVRVDEDLWQTYIEHRLKASESQEALWTAARDPANSSLLRRSAFEYLMLGDPGNLNQILNTALAVPDIRVGMWALAQTKGLPWADERARLLKSALAARHAAVRLSALRQYVTLKADDLDQRLRIALFDSARGVRALAAFELMRTCVGILPDAPLVRALRNGDDAVVEFRNSSPCNSPDSRSNSVLGICILR
jgi:hypothetical protein